MRNSKYNLLMFGTGVGVGAAVFFGVLFSVRAQVAPASAVTPVKGEVQRVIPQSGGSGQYVTIIGKNFGFLQGDVSFVQAGASVPADVSFSGQCQRLWWRDSAIIVKVPAGAKSGLQRIKIKRQDGEQAGEASFTVTDALPTPGICGIMPDNGPAGTPVTVYGERFRIEKGKVSFGNTAAEIAENGWSETSIRVKAAPSVTEAASTVRVVTADNTLSNPALFSPGTCRAGACGTGNACCTDGSCRPSGLCEEARPVCTYSWSFYTGRLGDVGAACTTGVECFSGVCGSDGKCALGIKKTGEQCSFDVQCSGGLCVNGLCAEVKKTIGEKCQGNEQCLSGTCTGNVCVPGNKKFGESCANSDQCASAICVNGACGQPARCLKVESIEPKPNEMRQDSVFTITFNQLVEQKSAKNYIQLKPTAEGTYEFRTIGQGDTAKSQVLFRPSELLSRQRRYTVDVGSNVRAAHSENTIGRCVTENKKFCNQPGEICTANGAVCTNGAICTGDNAVCIGAGTTCTGKGSTCTENADCSKNNRVIEKGCFPVKTAYHSKDIIADTESVRVISRLERFAELATSLISDYLVAPVKRAVAFFTSSAIFSVYAFYPGSSDEVPPALTVSDQDGNVKLNWTYGGTEYDGFEIHRKDGKAAFAQFGYLAEITKDALEGKPLEYIDRNIEKGVQYAYKIRAYKISPDAQPPGGSCTRNYECKSNNCVSGVCIDKPDEETLRRIQFIRIRSNGDVADTMYADAFGCIGNNCADDTVLSQNGNQHSITVEFFDEQKRVLSVRDELISWKLYDPKKIFTLSQAKGKNIFVTNSDTAGDAALEVSVPGTGYNKKFLTLYNRHPRRECLLKGGACNGGPDKQGDKNILESVVIDANYRPKYVDSITCYGNACVNDQDNRVGNQRRYIARLHGQNNSFFPYDDVEKIEWLLKGAWGSDVVFSQSEPFGAKGEQVFLTNKSKNGQNVLYVTVTPKEGKGKPFTTSILIVNDLFEFQQFQVAIKTNSQFLLQDAYGCSTGGRCEDDKMAGSPGNQHALEAVITENGKEKFVDNRNIRWSVSGDEGIVSLDKTAGRSVYATNSLKKGNAVVSAYIGEIGASGSLAIENKHPAKQCNTLSCTGYPDKQGDPAFLDTVIIDAIGRPIARDMYTCAGNDCEEDIDKTQGGNQHVYEARLHAQNNSLFPLDSVRQIQWSLSETSAFTVVKNEGTKGERVIISNADISGNATLSVAVVQKDGQIEYSDIALVNRLPDKLPPGSPCTENSQCASNKCENGKCVEIDGPMPPPCGAGDVLCADNKCYKDACPNPPGNTPEDPGSQCNAGEGCSSSDCLGKQDSCKEGLVCTADKTCGDPTDEQSQETKKPTAPSELEADAITAAEISLKWKDNADNESSFIVERSRDGEKFEPLKILGPNTTSYVDMELARFTEYWYRVSAVNSAGTSAYSNTAKARTRIITVCFKAKPSSPEMEAATALSSSNIEASWKDTSDNEHAFIVERSGNGESFEGIAAPIEGTVSYIDANLSPETQYWYRVKAHNCKGNSEPSSALSAKTLTGSGGKLPPGSPCITGNQCASNKCENGKCTESESKELPPGAPCTANSECASNLCVEGVCKAKGALGWNREMEDTDNDGLSDSIEDKNRNGIVDSGETDPKKPDTDGDGLKDGEEDSNHNGQREDTETDPLNPDTDGDGMNDKDDPYPLDPTRPVKDSDKDGLPDDIDPDPNNPDTDGDGLLDGQEDRNKNGKVETDETDPTNPDTDHDGLLDGQEDKNKNGMRDPDETSALNPDTDGDGLLDGVDPYPLDPTRPGKGKKDSDGDGLSDELEMRTKTNPNNPDTDGDGLLDGQEDKNKNGRVDKGETDPRIPDSDKNGIPDGSQCTAIKSARVSAQKPPVGFIGKISRWFVFLFAFPAFAEDQKVSGGFSEVEDITIAATSILLSAPTNLRAVDASDQNRASIKLTWEDSNANISGYTIFRKDGDASSVAAMIAIESVAGVKEYTDSGASNAGLPWGKTYTYQVQAYIFVNGNRQYSPASNTATKATPGEQPGPPPQLTEIVITKNDAAITSDIIFCKNCPQFYGIKAYSDNGVIIDLTEENYKLWNLDAQRTGGASGQSARGEWRYSHWDEELGEIIDEYYLFTPLANGNATLTATVEKNGISKSASVSITIDVCDYPWESGATLDALDIKLSYCRGNGSENTVLPRITDSPIKLAARRENIDFDEEYIFAMDTSHLGKENSNNKIKSDVIILRTALVDTYSPAQWYVRNFGRTPSPRDPVDGYQSVQDANGVYVVAYDNAYTGTNPIGSRIYYFTTNTGASAATREVVNAILQKSRFTQSMAYNVQDSDSAGAQMRRDAQRMADREQFLQRMSRSPRLPKIESGSFIKHQTISGWPSWQGELGRELGLTLPIDPYPKETAFCVRRNECAAGCTAAGYDKTTCWNPAPDANPKFGIVPEVERSAVETAVTKPDVHAYSYQFFSPKTPTGLQVAKYCTRFERLYVGTNNRFWCDFSQRRYDNTKLGAVGAQCGNNSDCEGNICGNGTCQNANTSISTNSPPAVTSIMYTEGGTQKNLHNSELRQNWNTSEQIIFTVNAEDSDGQMLRVGESSIVEGSSALIPETVTFSDANKKMAALFRVTVNDFDVPVGGSKFYTFTSRVYDNVNGWAEKSATFKVSGRKENHAPNLTVTLSAENNARLDGNTIIRNPNSGNLKIIATASDADSGDGDSVSSVHYTFSGAQTSTMMYTFSGAMEALPGSAGEFVKTIPLVNIGNGEYQLVVTAKDTRHGLYGVNGQTEHTQTLTIVTNDPPVINLTSPENNTAISAGSHVSFSGTIHDNDGVKQVLLYEQIGTGLRYLIGVAYSPLSSNASFNFSTLNYSATPPAIGTHTYKILAKDKYDREGEQTVTVRIENTPPAITITEPHQDTIIRNSAADLFVVSAIVTDTNPGDSIKQVTWQPVGEGSPFVMVRQGSTNTYTDSITISAGTHTILVKAYDSSDAEGSAQKTVTIRNNTAPVFTQILPEQNTEIDIGNNASVSVTISATASDDDGMKNINVIDVNTGVTIGTALAGIDSIATLSLNRTVNLGVGEYKYRYTATDKYGKAEARDIDFKVIVKPVDGGWTDWGSMDPEREFTDGADTRTPPRDKCSKPHAGPTDFASAGTGFQQRFCQNPWPSGGGSLCLKSDNITRGNEELYHPCNTGLRPEWEIGSCSQLCGSGIQRRECKSRGGIVDPDPQYNTCKETVTECKDWDGDYCREYGSEEYSRPIGYTIDDSCNLGSCPSFGACEGATCGWGYQVCRGGDAPNGECSVTHPDESVSFYKRDETIPCYLGVPCPSIEEMTVKTKIYSEKDSGYVEENTGGKIDYKTSNASVVELWKYDSSAFSVEGATKVLTGLVPKGIFTNLYDNFYAIYANSAYGQTRRKLSPGKNSYFKIQDFNTKTNNWPAQVCSFDNRMMEGCPNTGVYSCIDTTEDKKECECHVTSLTDWTWVCDHTCVKGRSIECIPPEFY